MMRPAMDFDDITYAADDGVATITINRPEKLNAFRAQTCRELLAAFEAAWTDRTIGAVILTGAGAHRIRLRRRRQQARHRP